MQVTISEVTTRGLEIQTAETKLLSPVVRLDTPTPPAKVPELLKASTTAEKLLFALNPDGRLKVTRPFVVTVARQEGVVTAHVEEIDEFGYGSKSGEALHDLAKTLSELYFSLRDNADRLSAELSAIWLKLNEHIELR